VLTSFGGGILVPITLGLPMVLHLNEAILPTMIAVWFVVNNVEPVMKLCVPSHRRAALPPRAYSLRFFWSRLQTRIGHIVTNTGFEVFRYHVRCPPGLFCCVGGWPRRRII